MKIATYNIWNSEKGMPERENQIINEINALDSDVIVLQEVKNEEFNENLLKSTSYKHYSFAQHEGRVVVAEPWKDREGLAVYSKYPITYTKYIEYALIVLVEQMGSSILFVNVHLPWDSVIVKEECIVNIIKEISTIQSDYRFILGDFNCSDTSSVHQFLKGDRSLNGAEVTPYWTDLAYVAEEFLGIKRELTLDLSTNPRWKGQSLTDVSTRVDCIFIHDCFPKPYPKLKDLLYFGKEVDEKSGMCASDHYGVFIDIQMPFEKL
ncbi:endonuclease/exonuclease/phosphatase family protein [Alkalicella caledoniensis]|uniref:Endonuclease/exonuclease/phosphatase family protein n=1 Tax=Alkalicella caledoniensis TaxID=2731377 RepID=A0A7G9WB84_ALKCA|nr:endonuclease/exonuclease/phosphatase family protein [Alkalicella caledoniensis]QNO15946.1 endonuclease/exonuclease/phosphatase family protein [Alkalicella caledoniensis]